MSLYQPIKPNQTFKEHSTNKKVGSFTQQRLSTTHTQAATTGYGKSNLNLTTVIQSTTMNKNENHLIDFVKKGKQFLDQKKFPEAITYFQQALDLTVIIYGTEDPEVKYSQEMSQGMLEKAAEKNNDSYWVMFTALTMAAVLSNFTLLKPIIGDPSQIMKCLDK